MNKNFNLYYLNNQYYNFLFEDNNFKEKEMLEKEYRPYIFAIGLEINNIHYVIPLSKDKANKYKKSHKYSFVAGNSLDHKNDILYINKMIPVINDKNFIYKVSRSELEKNHGVKTTKNLLKELDYLNQEIKYNRIVKLANEVYLKRYNPSSDDLKDLNLKFAVPFKEAEILMYKYAYFELGYSFDEYKLPKHMVQENLCSEFSEFDNFIEKNKDSIENHKLIHESQSFCDYLIKYKDGILELIEEVLDAEDDDGYFLPPMISPSIYRKWSNEELSSISTADFLENLSLDIEVEIDDIDTITEWLDKNFDFKNKSFQNR